MTDTRLTPTRLEQHAGFLHNLLIESKFRREIATAKEEELKAIIEALRNYPLFRKRLNARTLDIINSILAECAIGPSNARCILIRKARIIKAVLALILLKIIRGELHLLLLGSDG